MDEVGIAQRLERIDQHCQSNEQRIDKLEHDSSIIHDLATSVAVMAEQMKNMTVSVDTLSSKVGALEAEPGNRWKSVVEKVITTVIGIVAGYALAKIGLG